MGTRTASVHPGATRGAGHRERGQALPVVVLLVAFALVVALGLARYAREVADSSGAQHAADAVALAGAAAGQESAAEVAAMNDAELLAFAQDGDVVTVEIRRRGMHASARAELVVEVAEGGDSSPLPVGGD